jgi:hypothetical protein
MAVTTTIFEVVSSGQEFQIPGDWTPEQIVSTYSSNIPGLGNMTPEVTVEGDVKRIVFRPRTGTKG